MQVNVSLTLCIPKTCKTGTFVNSEDPDKMVQHT